MAKTKNSKDSQILKERWDRFTNSGYEVKKTLIESFEISALVISPKVRNQGEIDLFREGLEKSLNNSELTVIMLEPVDTERSAYAVKVKLAPADDTTINE